MEVVGNINKNIFLPAILKFAIFCVEVPPGGSRGRCVGRERSTAQRQGAQANLHSRRFYQEKGDGGRNLGPG